MKRSEMVELIRNNLDSGFLSEAEYILGIIESRGMLPPPRWRDKNYGDGHTMTYSQWIQLPSKINEWEPEQETEPEFPRSGAV